MSHSEKLSVELEPLARILDKPVPASTDVEHRQSFEIATAIMGLKKLPKDLRELPSDLHTALARAPEEDELAIQATFRAKAAVEKIYQGMVATSPKTDPTPDNRSYDPMEKECNAIEGRLRAQWWNEYYLPRTRPALASEFASWIKNFIEINGESAYSRLNHSSRGYRYAYEYDPKRTPGDGLNGNGLPSELKVPIKDLRLIPGWATSSLYVLAPEGFSVEKALPDTYDHNQVFRDNSPADQWRPNSIFVPNDVWAASQAPRLELPQ
ncbi:MAG TPA: hypothetical protein VF733_00370 [Candidatus Saccharimonadales bacterium]